MKHSCLFFALFILTGYLHSQEKEQTTIHQQQSEFYSQYKLSNEQDYDIFTAGINTNTESAALSKQVFGWNPYWAGTAYNNYNYNLLSTVAYFSYEVDPATGGYLNIHFWRTTNLVPVAHSHGVKVVLTATNFGSTNNTNLLSNASRRQRLIDSLFVLVKLRGADGVNIDFELVPASQRNNLTTFMTALAAKFHTGIPGSRVSIALPSVDWNNSFDVPALSAVCDQLIIMGYDYYWSSAPNAGPVSPLQNGAPWTPYNVTNSVNYYLNAGAPASKLMLAVPYYGYQWPTAGSGLNSATTGTGTAYVYSSAKTRAQTYGRLWDAASSTPWYRYNSGGWQQGWYDDSVSLGLKYDLVKSKNIAGIGIWALSYDGSNNELWNLINRKFGSAVGIEPAGEVIGYELEQNYPNPFNPVTNLRFRTGGFGFVTLKVYDMSGKEIRTLINKNLSAGNHSIIFDGTGLSSGVYYYTLETGEFKETKKMLLVK
jgi:spore germination protein YaaH